MRTVDPARKEGIIDAAAQLFAERHYHQVRMDDIAARAGISKGTLYLYFKDKQALYLALILHAMQRLFEEVRRETIDLGPPEERLRRIIREVIRFFHCHPYFVELIQRIEVSQAGFSTTPLGESRTRFLNLLVELLRECDCSGRFAVADPELAALALMGMIREILRSQLQLGVNRLTEWVTHQFFYGLNRG